MSIISLNRFSKVSFSLFMCAVSVGALIDKRHDISMVSIQVVATFALAIVFVAALLFVPVLKLTWAELSNCWRVLWSLAFFVGMAVEAELLFGVISACLSEALNPRGPSAPRSLGVSAMFAISGMLLIACGVIETLNVLNVLTHPCLCKLCRKTRVAYALELARNSTVFWALAWFSSAPGTPRIQVAIFESVGAAYLMGVNGCVMMIAVNRRRGGIADKCSRVPATPVSK